MDKVSHLTMKNLPVGDRPCEKLCQSGAHALSDAELLAVIIRSGSRTETALSLCQRLISQNQPDQGLALLTELSLEELTHYPGIGKVKAAQLKAAAEIGSRTTGRIRNRNRQQIRSPEEAMTMMETEMLTLPREELRAIFLDIRNRVIRICRIAEGSLSMSVIQPRDLFREAVRSNAAALILAHNHPSGDASPSREDIDTTRRLRETGDMMGVKVVDHLIIASGGSFSLLKSGLI
jgi:DNA repair protein RadC